MSKIRLDMSFKRADGGKTTISIDDARNDITEVEVNALMDQLITNSIFEPSGSPLAEKALIELITTDVVEFNIV